MLDRAKGDNLPPIGTCHCCLQELMSEWCAILILILILIGYRGYMSLKTSILRSYVGPLVCALLPSSRVTALSDVPRARKRRLLSNDRFDVYLRQVALKLATLCLLACASLTSAETLVVDESNHRGWTFFANPAVTVAGEAPVVGIG
jgi:hypothetical protein